MIIKLFTLPDFAKGFVGRSRYFFIRIKKLRANGVEKLCNYRKFVGIFVLTFMACFLINAKPITVRVLLSSFSHKSSGRWTFSSEKGFLIHSLKASNKKKVFCKNKVIVSVQKGHLFCNGNRVRGGIKLEPVTKYAECDGTVYDGDFSIASHNNSFLCVNHVDLEDYITAVLRTESWPGWPLEVNRAFAIMCRSYVMAKMSEKGNKNRLFDVKNTNAHQTYKGKHNNSVLKKAVEQTAGVVLGYNNKPILAMFDSCCGGVIPAKIADFDFKKVPYLARPYACTYCTKCSLYSWNISYDISLFEDVLKKSGRPVRNIRDVYVVKKDKAGLVMQVQLKGPTKRMTLTGKQFYSLFNEVKSFCFDISKKAQVITLSGKGFGHHLGLCQWGARQMVREGCDYKSILRYYYPDASLMKLA